MLAGDKIYWPTRTEIHVLDQATGLPAEPPIKLQESFQTTGGNLAVGDGYLIVAQTDRMVVFCQNSRLIQRYREEIVHGAGAGVQLLPAGAGGRGDGERRPGSAVARGGPKAGSAVGYHRRIAACRCGPRSPVSAPDEARAQGAAQKDSRLASTRYDAAAEVARSDRDRLSARLVLADTQLDAGRTSDAVTTLQQVLFDDRLRPLNINTEDGHRTIRADLLISDRLSSILRKQGRGLYADFDRQARALLERGLAENDPRLLEAVSQSYPVAQVVPESLLALGALADTSNRPGDAAHAYKRLLAQAEDDVLRARALWGLAPGVRGAAALGASA